MVRCLAAPVCRGGRVHRPHSSRQAWRLRGGARAAAHARDFKVRRLTGVLDAARLNQVRETIAAIPPDRLEAKERQRFGRSVVHNLPEFTALQRELLPLASEVAGEPLEISYNFLSLYSQAGVCEPHIDAPNAKWTLDICIDKSVSWPLFVSQTVEWPEAFSCADGDWRGAKFGDPSLAFEPFEIEPGGGLVFSGSSQWHYRPAIQPTRARQLLPSAVLSLPAGGNGRNRQPQELAAPVRDPGTGVGGRVPGGRSIRRRLKPAAHDLTLGRGCDALADGIKIPDEQRIVAGVVRWDLSQDSVRRIIDGALETKTLQT